MYSSSKSVFPFPPTASGVEWTAAQAGIRKDGRINPDPNPGENVSDVARCKLAQHQKLGSWSPQPGKVASISVDSFYSLSDSNKKSRNETKSVIMQTKLNLRCAIIFTFFSARKGATKIASQQIA